MRTTPRHDDMIRVGFCIIAQTDKRSTAYGMSKRLRSDLRYAYVRVIRSDDGWYTVWTMHA